VGVIGTSAATPTRSLSEGGLVPAARAQTTRTRQTEIGAKVAKPSETCHDSVSRMSVTLDTIHGTGHYRRADLSNRTDRPPWLAP
jgi:hypothetical protein